MADEGSFWEELDRRLEGDPIQVGDRSVQPVGRLTGKRFQAGAAQAAGAGAGFTLEPEEVIVREPDGERRIALSPPAKEPLRALFIAGGAVAGGCLLIRFLARRAIRRLC